ncbi:hypothetical protein ACFXJ8_22980 [Nonomuraea sp. NPDC059194]|uniref:hypothetical protein n=1 Tax=Nonomuraea sp. NPDC059194 TaxID=3346764 RepID=UPI0036810326
MRDFIFTEHVVEQGDPSIFAGCRSMLGSLGPEDYAGKRSAAFAFIEPAAGLGIENDPLDADEAPVVILDNTGT